MLRTAHVETPPANLRFRVRGTLSDDVLEQLRTLARQAKGRPVVVDLREVESFDTTTVDRVLGLRSQPGAEQLSVEGLEDAAARLTGLCDEALEPEPVPARRGDAGATPVAESFATTRLERTLVVRPMAGRVTEVPLHAALDEAVAAALDVTVVDLLDAHAVTPAAVLTLVEAGAEMSLAGRQLVVVNCPTAAADAMRRAGLSTGVHVSGVPAA